MKHSVLIVDDELGIRQSLTNVLEDEGYEVEAVASGEECLEALTRKRFALVLLDIWLPGMDGLQTLEKIQALEEPPTVIMISGHGTIETAVRATKLGAFDFIEKQVYIVRLRQQSGGGRAYHRRHQQKPAGRDSEGKLPGGPLLPPQRHSLLCSRAARARGRYSHPGQPLPHGVCPLLWPQAQAFFRVGHGMPHPLPLAGKCAGTAKPGGAAGHHGAWLTNRATPSAARHLS